MKTHQRDFSLWRMGSEGESDAARKPALGFESLPEHQFRTEEKRRTLVWETPGSIGVLCSREDALIDFLPDRRRERMTNRAEAAVGFLAFRKRVRESGKTRTDDGVAQVTFHLHVNALRRVACLPTARK